jgi:serine/threonine protein phosphatase PrpC
VPLEGDLPFEEEPAFGIAFSVHPGLRRDHSEDAAAMASGTTRRGDPFRVLVVCDGVSSSTHAEQASQVAARMVRDSLAQFCRTRGTAVESARQAMREALGEAHEAICAQRFELGAKEPPGTTCVAALVLRSRLIVGWVGDSRAYWLREEGGAELLTRDHSWANERVARGEATLEQAMRAPNAYALTRCLGPAELGEAFQPVQPDVVTRSLAGRGTVILCTDGLSNYYPIPEQMAALIKRCGPCPTPGRLARFLIHKALSRGGQDNVSVAVYQHRPGQSK